MNGPNPTRPPGDQAGGNGTSSAVSHRSWVACALAVLVSLLGAESRGQDPAGEDQPVPVRVAFNEVMFQDWVFGNQLRGSLGLNRLEANLVVMVEEIERSCHLSATQKLKLLMAGRGDLKRFKDRVAAAHVVFDELKYDQTNIQQILRETQPLANTLATGLFGEDSFYAKTLVTILQPEQIRSYRRTIYDRRLFQYRAKVELAVANFDATVGFTTDQARCYVDLILAETSPPTRPLGQFEKIAIAYKIAGVPDSKVRPIFDDAQWPVLNRLLARARLMEPTLRANGLLDTLTPAATRTGP